MFFLLSNGKKLKSCFFLNRNKIFVKIVKIKNFNLLKLFEVNFLFFLFLGFGIKEMGGNFNI